MNKLRTIENQILMFLGQQVGFVDAKKIALTFKVSTKTVYRTINKLNSSEIIIESQRGRGYKLIEDLKLVTDTKADVQRQIDMSVSLLTHFPNHMNRLKFIDKFYISDSTLTRDLTRIGEKLKKFNIQLNRSDGEVTVIATEVQVRKALNYFFLENTRTKNVLDNISEIFPNISVENQTFISSQMMLIEQKLNVQILEPYTINIFSHLYILLERVRQHRYEITESHVVQQHYDTMLTKVARQIILNISQFSHEEIPDQEINNLLIYLVGLRYDKQLDDSNNDEAYQLVDFLIRNLSLTDRYVNFETLKKGLLGHVRPMIHRIESGIAVVNPLLSDIKFSYREVFGQIRLVLDRSQYTISDDEIGFLTLYVVRALEEVTDHKRVLLMCSTGVGTAQLLQTKVRHAFPNFEIIDIVSSKAYQMNMNNYQNIDLVISTVNITYQPISPVIQVSALFNEGDKRRIEELIYG
ncbi:BglG family transcription antiterminator [Leuconostoc kimchii]|nr:PRD domain-containing protein [Leuconostoc kimchii]